MRRAVFSTGAAHFDEKDLLKRHQPHPGSVTHPLLWLCSQPSRNFKVILSSGSHKNPNMVPTLKGDGWRVGFVVRSGATRTVRMKDRPTPEGFLEGVPCLWVSSSVRMTTVGTLEEELGRKS